VSENSSNLTKIKYINDILLDKKQFFCPLYQNSSFNDAKLNELYNYVKAGKIDKAVPIITELIISTGTRSYQAEKN
jgi:hypothetical protein